MVFATIVVTVAFCHTAIRVRQFAFPFGKSSIQSSYIFRAILYEVLALHRIVNQIKHQKVIQVAVVLQCFDKDKILFTYGTHWALTPIDVFMRVAGLTIA